MHMRWNTTSECVSLLCVVLLCLQDLVMYVCMSCMLLQADVNKIQTG